MTVKQAKKRVSKNLKRTTKKTKQKEKYLVSLKREKALAGKGWKVARTKKYTEKPKKAIGKKGYPYAALNKESHYETFYTWKEKPSKKKKKPLKGTGGALAKKGGSLKKGLKEMGSLKSPSKKRKAVKTKTPKQKEKYKKKVDKRIRKGKDIGWGW